jgi:quercetin 2,3-dioxygenase
MEEFFTKMTEMGGKATEAEFAQLRADCGIQNFGPPLSASAQHTYADRLRNGFVVRAGESRFGEKTKLNGVSPNDIKVSGKDTGTELSVFEYNGNEKGGPPLHIHPHQDEVFYVGGGEYVFQCAEEKFSLQKGDMIFLPRGVAHAFAQLTEKGKMLFFFQPSGKMEDFFRTVGNSSSVPTPGDGERVFRDHDMKIVGPPLKF